jgi:hypothetical protein
MHVPDLHETATHDACERPIKVPPDEIEPHMLIPSPPTHFQHQPSYERSSRQTWSSPRPTCSRALLALKATIANSLIAFTPIRWRQSRLHQKQQHHPMRHTRQSRLQNAAESHMRVSRISLPAGQRRSKQIWKQLNPAKVFLMECRRQYLPRQHHLRQAVVIFLQVSPNPSHHLPLVD